MKKKKRRDPSVYSLVNRACNQMMLDATEEAYSVFRNRVVSLERKNKQLNYYLEWFFKQAERKKIPTVAQFAKIKRKGDKL